MTTNTSPGSPVGSSPVEAGRTGSGPARLKAPASEPERTRTSRPTAARPAVGGRRSSPADGSGNDLRRYGAELIGTALLVVVGVGVAVLAPCAGALGIALAFGLVLTVLAYTIGPISGCHINPAVTLGMALAGRISARRALFYVVAQIVGAIIGAAIVLAMAGNRPGYSQAVNGLGTNGWGAHSPGGYGFTAAAIVEVILTAVLVWTVIQVTGDNYTAQIAGLPIGLALLVAHLLAVPIDGTSVNPARSIGPALIHGGAALSQLWLFVVAPLIGAVLAVAAHRTLALRGDHHDAPAVEPTDSSPDDAAPPAAMTAEHRPTGGGRRSRKRKAKGRTRR